MTHNSRKTLRTRAGRGTRTAAAAAVLILVAPSPALAIPPTNDAQIQAGEAFLSNGYVEVGSRANGSFGSDAAPPSGYHSNTPGRLGFRADRDQDGWGVGSDDGDFFTPGSPYEAWGIQVGDAGAVRWNNNFNTDIPGAHSGPTTDSSGAQVTWSATAPVDGLDITQVASVSTNSLALDVDITLTNTTGSTMTNVYYLRAVDPDNCATAVSAVCDTDGDDVADSGATFMTRNEVARQIGAGDPVSAVAASQTDGSYFQIRTTATGSLAAISTAGFCNITGDLADFYTTPPSVTGCTVSTTKGDHVLRDGLIYLLIKTDSLAAGASRTFRMGYPLTESAARLPQTVTFPQPDDVTVPEGPIALGATASSGLDITYTSQTPSVCTIASPTAQVATLLGPGTCTIDADQEGDSTYEPADTVTRSFMVTKASQTITFSGPDDVLLPGGSVQLPATSSSGLTVTLTSQTPDVCTVDSSGAVAAAVLHAAGTCTIIASQGGDSSYAGAQTVTRSFQVYGEAGARSTEGSGSQEVTIDVPEGGSVTLLDRDGNPATMVIYSGQGTYDLSGSTITFTPDSGFTGMADPVTYRITDAYGNSTTATYTATVTGDDDSGGDLPSTGLQNVPLLAGTGILLVIVGVLLVAGVVLIRRRRSRSA